MVLISSFLNYLNQREIIVIFLFQDFRICLLVYIRDLGELLMKVFRALQTSTASYSTLLSLQCKNGLFLEFVVLGCQCYKGYFMFQTWLNNGVSWYLVKHYSKCLWGWFLLTLGSIKSIKIKDQKLHSLLKIFWGTSISQTSLKNRTNKIYIYHHHRDTPLD